MCRLLLAVTRAKEQIAPQASSRVGFLVGLQAFSKRGEGYAPKKIV